MTRGNQDVNDAIQEIEQVEDKLAVAVRESKRYVEGSTEAPVIKTEEIDELRDELTQARAALVTALMQQHFDDAPDP